MESPTKKTDIYAILSAYYENNTEPFKAYSPICGECKLSIDTADNTISVRRQGNIVFKTNKYGCIALYDGDCVIFPAKESTDWEEYSNRMTFPSIEDTRLAEQFKAMLVNMKCLKCPIRADCAKVEYKTICQILGVTY